MARIFERKKYLVYSSIKKKRGVFYKIEKTGIIVKLYEGTHVLLKSWFNWSKLIDFCMCRCRPQPASPGTSATGTHPLTSTTAWSSTGPPITLTPYTPSPWLCQPTAGCMSKPALKQVLVLYIKNCLCFYLDVLWIELKKIHFRSS